MCETCKAMWIVMKMQLETFSRLHTLQSTRKNDLNIYAVKAKSAVRQVLVSRQRMFILVLLKEGKSVEPKYIGVVPMNPSGT